MALLTARRRNVVFANLILTCVCAAFMSTALNTALPALGADTGIPSSQTQWLVSGYALALAVMMPLSAFLATRFSTRRLYLAALAAFIVGLLACSCTSAFALMMAGRALQAFGNAVISTVTQVTILTVFPKEERGQAMGWFGLSVSAAPIAAPPVAGVLVDALGWRSVFWLVAAAGVVSFVVAAAKMVDTLDSRRKPFDIPSFLLSALAFGSVTLGLGNVASLGIAQALSGGALAAGAVFGALFTRRQLKLEEPLLDLRPLASKAFSSSVVGSMLLYFVTMGSALALPLYLQENLGHTALASALVILPGSVATAVVNPVAGRVFDKLGIKALAILAAIALLASNAGMCALGPQAPLAIVAVLNILRCLAVGMLTMPFATWGNSELAPGQMPHATALLTSLRNVAGAIGTAVCAGTLATMGMPAAFALMTVASVALLVLALRSE